MRGDLDPRRTVIALGVQHEELGDDAPGSRVDRAHERAHLAAGDVLDGLAELLQRGVLEEHPHVPQALVLAHLDEVALGWRERVLEDADEHVRARPVGPCLRRASPELVLMQLDHHGGDLPEEAAAALLGRLLAQLVGGHTPPFVPLGDGVAQARGADESGGFTVGRQRGRAKGLGFRRCSVLLLRPWPRPSPAASVVARMVLTDTLSPARPEADRHDLIRVHGARVNNRKDVSVETPKRRLTAFTGVSGSGKSSLVFGTIAAESQRLINETYSAFVQGFMPTLARPEVDVLEGLTTAIIVDQERMGANPRSTLGTATDANAMLRILFSRLAQPHIGSPTAYSFNVPSVKASGAITVDRGAGRTRTERANFNRVGGMCPRCEGMGSVTDFDRSALYDDTLSLNEGALTTPGYGVEGWWGRFSRGCGFFAPEKPIQKFTKRELHDLLYKAPTKVKVEGINLTYEGLIPKIQKSFLAKDVDALQPHIRAFVERAVTFTICPECEGTRLASEARSSKVKGINIADACAMQISDLAEWVRAIDDASVAPLVASLQQSLDSFVEIGL